VDNGWGTFIPALGRAVQVGTHGVPAGIRNPYYRNLAPRLGVVGSERLRQSRGSRELRHLVAQARSSISAENLRQASAILGETFTADRLAVVQAALQRNLDQFQIVRDLEIDDAVEPAPAFDPRRR
jgi:hypothetical protein